MVFVNLKVYIADASMKNLDGFAHPDPTSIFSFWILTASAGSVGYFDAHTNTKVSKFHG